MGLESVKSLDEKFGDINIGTSFLDLPDEMIEKVFFCLDLITRCRVRGMNKRMYGIYEGMKKSLENRSKLVIYNSGERVRMTASKNCGKKSEYLPLDQSIDLIHRLLKIYNFETIKVTTCSMQLLNLFEEMRTGIIKIPPLRLGLTDNISSHFNRSTICNLMQNSDIVNINRICKNLNLEDLKHIYETAKTCENFYGIDLGLPRAMLFEFVNDFKLHYESKDYFSGVNWNIWAKKEEQMEIRVKIVRNSSCHCPNKRCNELNRVCIRKIGSEKKYPHIMIDQFIDFNLYCEDQYDDDEND